jgi:nitrogen fixation NifU-like protein
MGMDMNQLYSDIILEHNQNLSNKHELKKFTLKEHGHNPSCGDDITLQADIENGIVKDAAYTGHGCAISQASADMMIDLIKGKSVSEALRLVNLFLDMIKREVTDDQQLEELEDAISLKNISNMPARVKCAVLAWHTLKDALEADKK